MACHDNAKERWKDSTFYLFCVKQPGKVRELFIQSQSNNKKKGGCVIFFFRPKISSKSSISCGVVDLLLLDERQRVSLNPY